MRMVQKLLSFAIVGITLTLSTGFLNIGGEKPEEGVKALVTAIENNDHVAFMERVPKEYWVRLKDVYMNDHENPTYAWLKNIYVTSKHIERARHLGLSRAMQSYAISDAFFVTLDGMVASGDFANYCRKYKSPTLPFDPNVLNSLVYGEMGVGEQEGIIAAVATMPDGQEGVLGLAFIDKKWRVVSLAGNKKAAMDRAEAARKVEEDKLARIAARKKGAELYLQEMGPQIEAIVKAIAEKKWEEAAVLSIDSFGLAGQNLTLIKNKNAYDTAGFWDKVVRGFEFNIKNESNMSKYIASGTDVLKKSETYGDYIANFSISFLTEVIWKSDTVMLVKEISISPFTDVDSAKKLRHKWLNDDIRSFERNCIYTIHIKKNNKWIVKSKSYAQFEQYMSRENKKSVYFPFERDSSAIPVSVEKYNIELAKRFEELYTKAQENVVNEAKWEKEVKDIIAELNKAIVNNAPEVFEKHLALPMVIRDSGDLNETAIAIAKYGKSNADVNKFLDEIRNGTSKFSLKNLDIFFVDELEVVTHLREDDSFYLFERKKGDEPWKLARISTAGGLARPKDWDTKLAELVKEYEIEFALKNSVQEVLTALQKAYTAKDPTVFEQYIDLPSFLRDNGDLEKTAQAMAVNAKTNADVKAFLEQVSTGKWKSKTPLSKGLSEVVFVQTTPLEAVVNLTEQFIYLLLQRKAENDAWKIVRHASLEESLKRPENWQAGVNARVKILEEEIAKEEARKQKSLADMQKKMQEATANIVKAITEKNVPLAVKYMEPAMSILSLNEQDRLRSKLRSQLAPLYSTQEHFKQSITTGTAPSGLEAVWDAEAWKKAVFSFLNEKDKIVLGTLPTSSGNRAVLFVLFDGTYKLIAPPNKDISIFTTSGNAMAQAWKQLVANYKLDEPRQKLMFMVEALSTKNGQEFLQFVNVPNLVSWKNLQDRASGLEEQSHNELFEKKVYTEQSDQIVKSVSGHGKFTVGKLEITPSTLERSSVHILTPEMLMLETAKNNLLFVQKDKKYVLQGIVGELSAVQRGQFRQRFPDREKELANSKKALLRSVAAQTTSNAVLDLLQVTGGAYEVFKTEKGTVQLRVQATVQNKTEQAIKPVRFMMFFEDAEGQGWLPWVTKVTSENIKPGATQTFEWEFFPNEKEAYLLQQVEAGKMHFMVRTSEAIINKTTYKRFGTMVDPKQLPDGMWQLAKFAPVKPIPQWKSAEENAQKALWESMKKSKAAVVAHRGAINSIPKVATVATKAETSAQTETKPEVKAEAKPEAKAEAKPKAPVKAEVKPAPVTSAKTDAQPTAPAPKKPGKAVIVATTTDTMSLSAFAPDGKPDSSIRVLAHGKSPLVGVRVESIGAGNASWKTQSVKTKAVGVLSVMQDGKAINANDAVFSVDVSKPVSLDLVMQDNGNISNVKIRLRVIFFHKDGSRTYSIIQR